MALKTEKERFEAILADWAAKRGLPPEAVRLDEDGEVSIELGEAIGTLVYREATDTVILWFESGGCELASTPRGVLMTNDRFAWSRGFTLAIDPETDRLVVHDRRPAERFTSAETLDAWLEAGGELSSDVRRAAAFGVEVLEEGGV